MKVIKRKGFYYLAHSFRKQGKPTYRERYLGKEIPKDIQERKEQLLRECLEEEVFQKLRLIRKNFKKEWRTFPESMKKKVLLDLAINFTYNTNAIEGSTITLDETVDLVKYQLSPNKSVLDVQETIKHIDVFFKAINQSKPITLSTILNWHKELFQQTKGDIAGKFREHHVKVGSYIAPDWQDVKKLIKEFIRWTNSKHQNMHPVERAARVHYKFEKIHPFADGNGRVGRLLIVTILKQSGYPILTINYKKRKSYYKAFHKDEQYFIQYFMRRYLAEFKVYLKVKKK
jgi:Fic family protein